MSEELFNSASCSGDCADCGSDCQDLDQPTVTLTLDDDTEVKCAVLTIFPAPNQKEYIALLPLDLLACVGPVDGPLNGHLRGGEVGVRRHPAGRACHGFPSPTARRRPCGTPSP